MIKLDSLIFDSGSSLTSIGIAIPGLGAFGTPFSPYGKLTSISFPASLEAIGPYAFVHQQLLTTISFGSGSQLTSFGISAFQETALSAIIIPNLVTNIGQEAFSDTNISSVIIPATVSTVGQYAFGLCNNLTDVEVRTNVIGTVFFQSGNIQTIKFDYIGPIQEGFCNSWDKLQTATLLNVNSIGDSAFAYTSDPLFSITIPNTVTSIGMSAFESSGITSITIPPLVTILESQIFEDSKLSSIIIPNSITSIGSYAFNNALDLTSLTFEVNSQLTTIGDSAFYGTKLTTVSFPSSVTSIGDVAFENTTNLTTVTFDSNFQPTSFSSTTFTGSALTTVYMSSNTLNYLNSTITPPPDLSFNSNPIQSFFGATNVAIFSNTTFTNISSSIADVTTSIIGTISSANYPVGWSATDISSVDIGTSVIDISNNAFFNTSNMKSVTIPFSVTSIGNSAFKWSGLTSVNIPNSVTSIGDYAFQNITSLTSLTFDSVSQLTTIGYQAFQFSSLTSIILPASVITLGSYAFSNIITLLDITLNSNVNSFGFFGLNSMKTITFDYVGLIQASFCNGRTNLDTATLLNVTSIEDSAFEGTISLNSIIIPNSVNTIKQSAFKTSGLTSITIPSSVTSIGNQAFSYTTSLTSVIFDSNFQPTTFSSTTFTTSALATVYMSGNTLNHLNSMFSPITKTCLN